MSPLSSLFSKIISFVKERGVGILAIRAEAIKVDSNKIPILNGVPPLSFLYFFLNSERGSLNGWYYFETGTYIGKPLFSALFFH